MFRMTASIGIEISTHNVRAALIEKKGSVSTVQALINIPVNGAALETILARLKKELNQATRIPWYFMTQQALAIPQSHVVVKRFPALEEKNDAEQYTQAGITLSESLSMPLDEMLYDYRYFDDMANVEAFACRRSQIEPKLNALEATGFALTVLEPERQSLMRLFQQHQSYQPTSGTALLVDLNAERVQLCFDDGKEQPLMRDLPLPFDIQQASYIENRANFTEKLADDILRQFQLINTSLADGRVRRVWLAGEAAKYVDNFQLEQRLNWDVLALNPLVGLNFSESLIDNIHGAVGAWSTAIGLALREAQ